MGDSKVRALLDQKAASQNTQIQRDQRKDDGGTDASGGGAPPPPQPQQHARSAPQQQLRDQVLFGMT